MGTQDAVGAFQPLSFSPVATPQVSILNKYSEAIRGNLTKIMRLKIVALVTIEIHARDVLEKLYKGGLMDVNAFDWLSQLRFYWEKVAGGQAGNHCPSAHAALAVGAPHAHPSFALTASSSRLGSVSSPAREGSSPCGPA